MSDSGDFWTEMERPGPRSVLVDGVTLARGSHVILRPRDGADIMDLALSGRQARVESLEQDQEGRVHVAVTLDDDPGRDLGEGRLPGHRFFFSSDEVEPIDYGVAAGPPAPRILVAGIGNIFLGDDGFGPAVARRLAERALPAGVEVKDFGIRGLDLAYALQGEYDAAVLVDAAPRGAEPGSLYVIEPDQSDDGGGAVPLDTHGMDPVRVMRLARAMGGTVPRTLVVGCEPYLVLQGADYDDMEMELSAPVVAALDGAVALVESVVAGLIAEFIAADAGGGPEAPPG
jgi:hydrogenase maturation protease